MAAGERRLPADSARCQSGRSLATRERSAAGIAANLAVELRMMSRLRAI